MECTTARGNWYDLATAPKTGKAIRLRLRDGMGEYGFEPAAWDKKQKAWVNARNGKEIIVLATGWMQLQGRSHYGEMQNRLLGK
jgi:hypothetical protein